MSRLWFYSCGFAAGVLVGGIYGYMNGWDDHTRETETNYYTWKKNTP